MVTVNPYLNFNGNTEEVFNFYKSVFGGEFSMFQRFNETPAAENLSEVDKGKVLHVSLPIGNGVLLMGSDTLESMGHTLVVGNNVSISINTESKEETDKLFKGLSDGGKIKMPLQDTFWGAYFGMFDDKFGIQWMINYDHH